jgi:putative transposase
MTETDREAIAAQRYRIIAGVVNRATPLNPGEIRAWFLEMTEKSWTFEPYWRDRHFGVRTLERWKSQYERLGLDGLKPAPMPKRGTRAIPADLLQLAETIRRNQPALSVETILYHLVRDHGVAAGSIHPSTLSRHFRRNGLTRAEVLSERNQDYGYRRFETDAPMRLWQSDFHHTLYLPDPLVPGKKRLAKLCAIVDDYSRYFVHAQYYWDERMPCLEDCLKKAIEKHGIVEQFYCDNGSAFSAGHITRVCARLGIRLSHSRPYKPQGRGKIERVFRFVDSSFKPDALAKIAAGQIVTLDDLNRAFTEWVMNYYHQRTHGTTHETPQVRLERFPVKELPYSKEALRRFFFLEETRKVDKAGCVSLNGASYEVAAELAGLWVQIRYDPFAPNDAEVAIDGQLICNARLLDASANFHARNRKARLTDLAAPERALPGQLEFTVHDTGAVNP